MNHAKWDAVYAAALVAELKDKKNITETDMREAIENAKAIADLERETSERMMQETMSATLLKLRLGKHGS